ncbi:MAG: SH3 domain-containing protein [Bacillota bacterium]
MQKKLFALMVVVVMVTMIATAAFAMVGQITMYVYTSNGKSLNLREEPSTNAKVVASIPYGAAVNVYQPYSSTWYSVGYKGITGYVMSKYLVTNPPGPKPTIGPSPTVQPQPTGALSNDMFKGFTQTYYQAQVRPSSPSGYVNMRWAPSKMADIHGHYYQNDLVIVMSENSTWTQILDQKNQVMGFMMRQFLAPYQGDGLYASDIQN